MAQVEAIESKTGAYGKILQVNVPVRFYWDTNGEFDGVEFGPFDKPMLPWEEAWIEQCLDALQE
ncbi:MAG: hypothetical protein V3W37_06410 [Candidatus Binatia bacterium]